MDTNNNEPKKLYRSNCNKMLCGVCAGVGNYFNLDATIIRLLFVLFGFCSFGTGILAYIILAVIIPTSPYQE
ncbi:MAG: PspC domain-containing protein [Lachnospiraceae bacterium]